MAAETDPARNRYERDVTMRALRHFVVPGMRVIDYGCGSGVFTAEFADWVGTDGSSVGTDASTEMLKCTTPYATKPWVGFEHWDACQSDSPLQDGTADLVVAKLSLNNIPPTDLYKRVLPRLRACLKDTGLLVAVLPDPSKETSYDIGAYADTEQVSIQVGDFGDQLAATAYHPIEYLLTGAYCEGSERSTIMN